MTGRLLNWCLCGVVAAQVATASLASAQSARVNMMAGPDGSTAMAISSDIAGLARECGINPDVHVTNGALENLLAVKERQYTQFGIIQADVMDYLRTFEAVDPAIARVLRGIKLSLPLYREEIHVVASMDVASFADLTGKRVSLGDQNSDTFLTATVMMDLLGIKPAKKLTLQPRAAMEALAAGEIDAFIFVDGAPSKLLQDFPFETGTVQLLPLDDPLLSAIYRASAIDGGTYSFAAEDTPVMQVSSMMITFDYVPTGRNNYNTFNCKMVSDVTRLVHDNIADLATIGHPKWIEVVPTAEVNGLELSACAKIGLQEDYTPQCK